jgi:F420-dependent oxidoreductase-like protein
MVEAHRGANYEQQLRMAQAAERLGFAAFTRTEHYTPTDGSLGEPGPTDAWLTLAAIARETTAIRLGTLMTCTTFRYPTVLAVMVAQADQMSNGRVELGIGAGWFEGEHHVMGVPFPQLPERIDRFEEQLAILRGLWSLDGGDRFSFNGEYFKVEDNPGLPRPVQPAGPPIVIGGKGVRRLPRLAVQYAAEFNSSNCDLDNVSQRYGRVIAACEKYGRDRESMKFSHAIVVCCGRTDREIARRLEVTGQDLDTFNVVNIAGPPEYAIERIKAFADLGTQRMYLQLLDMDDIDHAELIANAVLPHV